jgi:hypothetical protein
MLLLKILLVGAVIVGGMAAVKDGRLLARAGLTSSCEQVQVQSPDSSVQRCKKGRLDGYPDLTNKSCKRTGTIDGREYWTCPALVVSSHAPRG